MAQAGYGGKGGMIQVTTDGIRGTERAIADIRSELPEVGKNIMEDLATRLQISAKRRVAPQESGSGELKRSIDVEWVNQWSMRVTAGNGIRRPQHAVHQEYGFQPHYVHISQWMGDNWEPRGEFAYVREHTPYMRPAVREITKTQKVDEVIQKHLDPQLRKIERG